jgi:hypothetical protein
MTPEQRARQGIDALLAQAGWVVQDYAELDLYAGVGLACRELPLTPTSRYARSSFGDKTCRICSRRAPA